MLIPGVMVLASFGEFSMLPRFMNLMFLATSFGNRLGHPKRCSWGILRRIRRANFPRLFLALSGL
jgi:hypothetical protein